MRQRIRCFFFSLQHHGCGVCCDGVIIDIIIIITHIIIIISKIIIINTIAPEASSIHSDNVMMIIIEPFTY